MSASPPETSSTDIWQQYREVNAGPLTVVCDGSTDDLDIEIEVRDAKDEGVSFTVGIWNLAPETWAPVSQGDEITITLGWLDGPQAQVALGIVKEKKHVVKDTDTKFLIKGLSISREKCKTRLTQTYEGLSPSEIASDLAENIGLSVARTDSSPPIEGRYVIKDDQPARHWFDELVNEAELRTESQWEWDAKSGSFWFVKKENPTTEAPILSYDYSLLSLDEATGRSDSDSDLELEFETLCEPEIRKGGTVVVDTDDHTGVFKVADVTHKSDTVAGDHKTVGTLVPAESTYSVNWPGTGRIDALGGVGIGGGATPTPD